MAVVGFIEAGARLHVQHGGCPPAQGRRPGADDGLKVVADEGGLVGVDSVDDNLDFRGSIVERVRRVALQGDEGVRFMGAQFFFSLPGREDARGLEISGRVSLVSRSVDWLEAGTARYAMRTFLMSMLMP